MRKFLLKQKKNKINIKKTENRRSLVETEMTKIKLKKTFELKSFWNPLEFLNVPIDDKKKSIYFNDDVTNKSSSQSDVTIIPERKKSPDLNTFWREIRLLKLIVTSHEKLLRRHWSLRRSEWRHRNGVVVLYDVILLHGRFHEENFPFDWLWEIWKNK